MNPETSSIHQAIGAYNQAQTALWKAKELHAQCKDRLIHLLQAYPATTPDPAIRHHILCTERRELTDAERSVIYGDVRKE